MDSPLGPYSWIPRILSIFDKMREHQPFKAPAKNYENRARVCMDIKNNLAWLTGIKKLIFHSNNFFGSSHFSIDSKKFHFISHEFVIYTFMDVESHNFVYFVSLEPVTLLPDQLWREILNL